MNEIKVFANSEFGELSVLEMDGKMYFPATACAKKLGYQDAINAIKQHCKGVVKHHLPTNGGMQTVNMIPEGDLYRLIAHSRLPAAERFERWVFDEVLPTIRKTGGYGMAREEIVELVRDTVQATIGAMLRPEAQWSAPEEKRRRIRGRNPSIIGRLDTALRQEVEDMLLSRRYTFNDISKHLLENYGVHVSTSSIHRYAVSMDARTKGEAYAAAIVPASIYPEEFRFPT